jgi:DNA polymerase-1
MSAAEIRIAADYSGDGLLIDSILNGADMHSKLSSVSYSIIFGQDVIVKNSEDEIEIDGHTYVLSELRGTHKSAVFAKFYKGGPKRIYGVLSKYINHHHKTKKERDSVAWKISQAMDRALPKLSLYLTSLIDRAKSQGWLVSSVFGRIRYFDKEKVYGQACNYPIQGINAEAMKMALINIDKLLTKLGYGRIVMNIHDEVVIEAPTSEAELLAPKIQKIVADSLGYFLKKIPGAASVKISDHWEK